MGYAAHLRVYEPMSALPDSERERWQEYVAQGDLPSRPVQMAREHEVALSAVLVDAAAARPVRRRRPRLRPPCRRPDLRLPVAAAAAGVGRAGQLPLPAAGRAARRVLPAGAVSAAADDARDAWVAEQPRGQGRHPHLDLAGAGGVVHGLRSRRSAAGAR